MMVNEATDATPVGQIIEARNPALKNSASAGRE